MTKMKTNSDFPSLSPPWTASINERAGKFRDINYVLTTAFFFIFSDFIYLFMRGRERERKAETQAEGEVGSLQRAQCGTDPGSPGSCPG